MDLQHKKKSKEEIFAVIGLIIVAVCWGFGFLGLRYTDALPTFYIQAIRFGVAAVALAIACFPHLKNINKELLKAGISEEVISINTGLDIDEINIIKEGLDKR